MYPPAWLVNRCAGNAAAAEGTSHRALLQACLLVGDEALDAWHSWQAIESLEHHDDPSFELFPLLYRNLVRQGWEGADLARLRGVYRQSWYRNRMIVRQAELALSALSAAEIPTLVLSGAAMAAPVHHGDLGVRPIADVDLLVRRADAAEAIRHLANVGWAPTETGRPIAQWIECHDAVALTTGPLAAVCLRWDLLATDRSPAADAALWDRAVTTTLDAAPVMVLGYTDQLLLTLATGEPGGLRWIADCVALVVQDPGAIEWARLVDEARARRTVSVISRNIARVEGLLPGTIPPDVVREITDGPRHRTDRLISHAPTGSSRREGLANALTQVRQRTRHLPPVARLRVARMLFLDGMRASTMRGAVRQALQVAVHGTRSRRGRR